jgi:WD40 repeat protein
MAVSHAAHQSVPVAGNRALIISGGMGDDPASFTNIVELYNPVSGASLLTGGLNTGRGSFSATLLRDRRVLVVGGYNAIEKWVANAEIYDPISGSWSLNQPLYNHGIGHTATLLIDGRVLVTGGCMADGIPGRSNRTELFDPATNSWTDVGTLSQPRCGHVAALLSDGRVVVAGGENGEVVLSSVDVFNPVTGLWSQTGNLNVARRDAAAVQMLDGRVIVSGGAADISGRSATLDSAEIYDANLGKWGQVASMSQSRSGHTVNLLPGGLVLVAGGLDVSAIGSIQYLDSVEVYDPQAGTWASIARLNEPRAYHAATLLPDGRVFVTGGIRSEGASLASTEYLVVSKPPILEIPTPYVDDTRTPTMTPLMNITSTLTGTLGISSTSTSTSTVILEATLTPTSTPEGYIPVISRENVQSLVEHNHVLDDSVKDVYDLSFSVDGRFLAAGTGDGAWYWTADSGWQGQSGVANSIQPIVYSVAFSPDGNQLYADEFSSGSYQMLIWDYVNAQVLSSATYFQAVSRFILSKDGTLVVVGLHEATSNIFLVDTDGFNELMILDLPGGPLGMVFSPDGTQLAAGSYEGEIKLWDFSEWSTTHQVSDLWSFQAHSRYQGYVECLAFSPDGSTLVSGSNDKTIKWLDASSGRIIRTLSGNTAYVSDLAFTPDGLVLVSGSQDGTVKFWDSATGDLLYTLNFAQPVQTLAISPDGSLLVIGTIGDGMYMYGLP